MNKREETNRQKGRKTMTNKEKAIALFERLSEKEKAAYMERLKSIVTSDRNKINRR